MPGDLIAEAYFQANTIKGHRYLDDAGKIMNRWDSHFPDKLVGVEGLVMTNMNDVFRRLRVDNHTIWLHWNIPDGIEQVTSLAHTTISEIAEIIGVDQFRRVGLRVQYVYGIQDSRAAAEQVSMNLFSEQWCSAASSAIKSGNGFEFMVPLGTGELGANLRVSIVRRNPKVQPRKPIPNAGMMGLVGDFDLLGRGGRVVPRSSDPSASG